MDVLSGILLIAYFIAGYWATGKTLYANKIIIDSVYNIFMRRLIYGALFGWILIPVAIIRTLLGV